MSKESAAGASKSLNKTITEIMKHLGTDEIRPNNGLRAFLREKIGDLSERWYRRGFKRGHIESHKEFKANARVPRKLQYTSSRNLSPGQDREIELKSAIRKSSKKPRK